MDIDWKLPWRKLNTDHSENDGLQTELQRELSAKHLISNPGAKVIARRVDNDDVLVLLTGGKVAVVHLAFTGEVDQLPEKYPRTTIYRNISEFVEQRMKMDALEYDQSI